MTKTNPPAIDFRQLVFPIGLLTGKESLQHKYIQVLKWSTTIRLFIPVPISI